MTSWILETCGATADTSSLKRLWRAATELAEGLDRQWIVWLEGRILPHRIVLSNDNPGVRLAGGTG